ncbi:YcaO-like family protein [Streptomyces sp. NPDC088752]|uniref:YcaO-like family protein n=1 Tax=Streptomyces sp. NPDC088752 TaxID=3154963 RepID=UPI00343EF0CF
MNVSLMRPQLIRDAYFVPLDDDGVYLRSSHRVMTIERAPVYPWLERLAPYLDGGHIVAELVAGLPERKAALVTDLIRRLHDQRLVRDLGQDLPHTLGEWELRTYEAELAYVETYTDSAEHHFQRYRETPTLLVGSGRLVEAAVQAVLKSGVRQVRVLITGDTHTDLERLRDQRDAALARDALQELSWTPAPVDAQGWTEALRGYEAVLHLSERPMSARGRMLDAAAPGGTLTQHAVVLPNEAWIGPIRTPAGPGGGWEPAWRRLCPGTVADLPNLTGDLFTGALPPIVANHAVFRLFTHVTGTGEHDWTNRLLRVDLETLETTHHRYHPHPHALPAGPHTREDFLARSAERARGREQSAEELSVAAVDHLDPRSGLFAAIEEQDATQLPLRVSHVSVPHPVFRDSAVTVYGSAIDFVQARHRAMHHAVELYAAALYNPRRANPDGTVWGLRLPDDGAEPVDAAKVFLTTEQEWRAGVPIGTACGRTWDEALTTGLLRHCEELTVANAAGSEQPRPRVDLAALAVDDEVAHLVRLLEVTGADITVHDVTDPELRVPTLVFDLDGTTVACAAGLDFVDAAVTGLERTLLRWQADHNDEPGYAPIPVPPLPDAPCDDKESLPHQIDLRTDPVQQLVAALLRAGWRPVAVPLDHDPALTALAPYVLRIVLVHD